MGWHRADQEQKDSHWRSGGQLAKGVAHIPDFISRWLHAAISGLSHSCIPLTQTVSTLSPGGRELVGASAHSQATVKTLLFKVCYKHTILGFLRAKRTLCIIGGAINPCLSLAALASSNLLKQCLWLAPYQFTVTGVVTAINSSESPLERVPG